LIYDFIPAEVNSSFVSDLNGKKQTSRVNGSYA